MWGKNVKYARAYRGISINGKKSTISMSREIMKCPPGMVVDHINGDTLDNQRKNLRICTIGENNRNSQVEKNRTGYKGVSWNKGGKKWMVQIAPNRTKMYLGCFTDPQKAAMAYNEAAKKYFGEFAKLNIIKSK